MGKGLWSYTNQKPLSVWRGVWGEVVKKPMNCKLHEQ